VSRFSTPAPTEAEQIELVGLDMSQNGYNKTQEALVKAVTLLCKPLIRLLIEKGLTFPQFRDLMKILYVDVANETFTENGNQPSDSRIFVLTGVHRKDIKRIREQSNTPDQTINNAASLNGEIVARWISMPEYLDKKGKPRKLLRSKNNNQAGFEQLVSSVNKDVRPKVILDEWLRLNMVSIKDDYIVLRRTAYVSNKEFNDMAYYLGHNVHDHLASCVNNILVTDNPMIERSVYYASLTENSVNKLRSIANKKGNELLQHLNKQAIKLYDTDKLKDDANYRIRLGVYWFQASLKKNGELK